MTESQSAHDLSKFLGGQGLTELLSFGASTLAESGVICKLTGWGCFVAGTEVVTGQNTNGTFSETPIQDIQVGDYVLSRNQYDPNGPLQEEQVTAVEQHTVFSLQNVTVEEAGGTTEVIQATPNHPFYVEGQGWMPSGDLIAGDELEEPDGSFATVVSSVGDPQSQGVTVYNFTVANDHTYFVDQGGAVVWVHNTCVYRALLNGEVEYVGITNDFERRAAEHLLDGRVIEEIPGLEDLTRKEARAIEDLLIKKYGRAGIDPNGILSNINRGIDPRKLIKYADVMADAIKAVQNL